MGIGLGRAFFPSLLLLGCTGLNPQYADATGGQPENKPSTTTRDATGTDPSSPTNPSETTAPTTHSTLEPTDGSSDSTTGVGPGTEGTRTSSEGSSGTTTGVEPSECSTYLQDCAGEQKCMPFADDGGGTWNALGCFPLDPGELGDPEDECTVEISATSGRDDCGATSMCWNVSPDNNVGTCTPFCTGSPGAPECGPDRICAQSNGGVLALCEPLCNPVTQDCDKDLLCVPLVDGFVCAPDASGAGGGVGEACQFINDCDPGNFCLEAEFLGGCENASCCTPFCNLEAPGCEGPSVCLAYYEDGAAPLGYENVGFCGAA